MRAWLDARDWPRINHYMDVAYWTMVGFFVVCGLLESICLLVGW